MKITSRTHVGNVRPSNQDSLLIQDGKYGLYGVADGMGGHNGGDVASQLAVLMLGRVLEGAKPQKALLKGGIEEINLLIYKEQQKNELLSGMGTTLTVLWEGEKELLLGHVGDSRAYLIRDGQISQVSEDHSVVAEMVRSGAITEEEAKHHPYRNVITQAVGTGETVQMQLCELKKKRGDKYLICSDGLYEYIDKEEMLKLLQYSPVDHAADTMLEKALEMGGKDNITLLIAEVTE